MDESYLEWLSSIPGSDAERARRIAERFSSYDQLRAATREQLASVEGLTTSFVDALLSLLGDSPGRDAAEHLFLCPECGSFVGTNTAACPFCGVQFDGSTGPGLPEGMDEFLGEDVPTRICQTCGATLCCDNSPNRHATKHAKATNHPVIASAEPGERWLYCYPHDAFAEY